MLWSRVGSGGIGLRRRPGICERRFPFWRSASPLAHVAVPAPPDRWNPLAPAPLRQPRLRRCSRRLRQPLSPHRKPPVMRHSYGFSTRAVKALQESGRPGFGSLTGHRLRALSAPRSQWTWSIGSEPNGPRPPLFGRLLHCPPVPRSLRRPERTRAQQSSWGPSSWPGQRCLMPLMGSRAATAPTPNVLTESLHQ